MTSTEQASTQDLHQEQVIGAGGRQRTVWTGCPWGHWHGSYSQGRKCIEKWNKS